MSELSKAQQAFAQRNQSLIYGFLRRNALDSDEWYDIVAIGFLKAVLTYHDQCGFDFWSYWHMKNEWYMEQRRQEKKQLTPSNHREGIMENKRFVWGAAKKARLVERYGSGASIPDLAADFETDEETIYKAIDKLGLVRKLPADPSEAEQAAGEQHSPRFQLIHEKPAAEVIPLFPDRAELERSKSLINNAFVSNMNIVELVKNHLDTTPAYELGHELGKQYMALMEADRAISSILTRFHLEP